MDKGERYKKTQNLLAATAAEHGQAINQRFFPPERMEALRAVMLSNDKERTTKEVTRIRLTLEALLETYSRHVGTSTVAGYVEGAHTCQTAFRQQIIMHIKTGLEEPPANAITSRAEHLDRARKMERMIFDPGWNHHDHILADIVKKSASAAIADLVFIPGK